METKKLTRAKNGWGRVGEGVLYYSVVIPDVFVAHHTIHVVTAVISWFHGHSKTL